MSLSTIENQEGISSQEGFGDPSKIIVSSVFELPTTSIAVDSQLPEFVRSDHQKFVQFLKTYYDWMDIKGNTAYETKRIKQYADIDSSTAEFEELLHRQFLVYVPRFLLANKPQVLKHIRDFYRAKGTEKSFQFFFRALYNSPAEFYYPRKDILKVSDGKYIRHRSIRIELISGNAKAIQGSIVSGLTTTTSCYVDRCMTLVTEGGTYYELFLNRSSITGNFSLNETIQGKDKSGNVLYTAKIVPVLSKIDVVQDTTTGNPKAGSAYQYGDEFLIENDSGRLGKIKVSSVNSDGSIKKLSISDFGVNYSVLPFYINLDQSTTTKHVKYSISSKSLTFEVGLEESALVLTASGISGDEYVKKINSFFFDGSIVRLVSSEGQKTYNLKQKIWNLNNTSVRFELVADDVFVSQKFIDGLLFVESITGTGATVKITPGVFCDYPGYYISNNGQLSETKYLHDGEFYQQFSYLVYSKESAETYRTYLKDMIHPLGLKFYGSFRDPNKVENKTKANAQAAVTRKFQQYPRHHLFFDVPTPELLLVKNGQIQVQNRDFTILSENNGTFSIRFFGSAIQSTDLLDVLYKNSDANIVVNTLQAEQGKNTYTLTFDVPLKRYESLIAPVAMNINAPSIERPKYVEKSPALDAIKIATCKPKLTISSSTSDASLPLGSSLSSIYRERFRYQPTEHITDGLSSSVERLNDIEEYRSTHSSIYPNYEKKVLSFEGPDFNGGLYWGNLSSPALQYANTQIRHFKHLIPKSLESGDVPDIVVAKNGNILRDNVDYIIVGKKQNPWARDNYCIRLIGINNTVAVDDVFEVTFRDVITGKIKTTSLNHGIESIIEIPHSMTMLRPQTRINIMPDAIVTRGIVDETE